jgi:membrane protein DedA with SNARE-associated domain
LSTLAFLDPTSFVSSSGYLAIFVLSMAQSCCIPTSSELTLGFAGVLAARGQLSLEGVIAAGAGGELVGAYVAWFIGRLGGRTFVDRFGRYILLSHHDLDRAEAWYRRRGPWGVFASRLLPVIRNFVALPAGVAEVPLLRFGLLTAAGSLIWDAAMALIGYEVGSNYHKVVHGFSDAGYVLGALAVVALAALLAHRYRSYKSATGSAGRPPAHFADPSARRPFSSEPGDVPAGAGPIGAPGPVSGPGSRPTGEGRRPPGP